MGHQKRISLEKNSCQDIKQFLFSKAFELGELCSCEAVVDIKSARGQFHTFANEDAEQLLKTVLGTIDKKKCMEAANKERMGYILLFNNINNGLNNQGK